MSRSAFRATSFFVLLACYTAGCADSVEPTFDADKPYTLYGVLDPTADVQALRVVPFAPDLTPDAPAPVGAEVTLTNLSTGEVTAWQDSLVTFPDGRFGSVYAAAVRPDYGNAYRVEARRADGAVARAEVVVPPLVEPLAQPIQTSIGVVVLRTLWAAAPRINDAQVVFVMEDTDCNRVVEAVPTSRPAEPFEFGWYVSTDFLADAAQVREALAPSNNLALLELRLRALVSSEDWEPRGGTFDPEVLVDPNALTNVEGGFGFVGGGYTAEVEVVLPGDVKRRGGFRGRMGCGG